MTRSFAEFMREMREIARGKIKSDPKNREYWAGMYEKGADYAPRDLHGGSGSNGKKAHN